MKTKWFKFFCIVMSLAILMGMAASGAVVPRQSWIVQGGDVATVRALVERYGGEVTSELEIIHGVGALLTPRVAQTLRTLPGITAVTPNAPVQLVSEGVNPQDKPSTEQTEPDVAQMISSVYGTKKAPERLVTPKGGNSVNSLFPATDAPDLVGADLLWSQGFTGDGVAVAILDTGLGWHPGVLFDTEGNVRLVGWKDFVQRKILPVDPNGHGTHVAGIIADSMIGSDNEFNGVAPDVNLVAVRVLNREGYGTYERVIQGIQWVVQRKDLFNVKVMNLSLVSPVQSSYWADPLNQAVMQAWAAGITVVAAAGNSGPAPMTIGVPGNNPYVITVGAFTDNYTPFDWNDDYITPFSAAGPTLDGFVKPDVVAPGAHVVSTILPGTYMAQQGLAQPAGLGYYWTAGTSQSAAVVSGIAALVASAHPDLTPNEIKLRVQATSFPWVDPVTQLAGYSIWQQGFGRVNAYDAVLTTETDGFAANMGMDIQADIAGTMHYEGYSYYDETTGEFKLNGGYGSWSGGYGSWSGGYGSWSGGYGSWSGGYGSWSGGYGSWSGGYGSWSGGYGSWSGGYGSWSGGYGSWSGGYGSWSGSEPWAGTYISEASFLEDFLNGVSPDATTTTTSIGVYTGE